MTQVFSIRRLRYAMVAGVLTLVGVLAVFIARGRFFRPNIHINLKKLGIDVTTDSDSVTYSHTNLGITQYTIHAAKRIQHKDGTVTLRDVGITIYGAKGERKDHIHGNQFEYDEKNHLMTAVGEVFIDLAPPSSASGRPTRVPKPDDDSRIVHLKTSGLVYHQTEQLATTDSRIDFVAGGITGNAIGASYDAMNEIIVLRSDVHASGLRGHGPGGERPMVLTASHAEIDMEDEKQKEAGNVAFLEQPKLVEATEHGTETGIARHAVVHMSADGTPKQVLADGSVTLIGEGRGTVTSDRLDMDISPAGQPTQTHLAGSVRYKNELQARHETGKADDARVAFDKEGRPVHAVMAGSVETRIAEGESTRWLGSDKLELELAGGGKQPVEVRAAQATAADGARMSFVDAKPAKGKVAAGIVTTNVRADVLNGRFLPGVKQTQVSAVDGNGRTFVERIFDDRATGVQSWKESGSGDTLHVDFHQVTAPDASVQSEVARAEQHGSVKIIRDAVATKPGAPNDVEHAEGDDAVYNAEADDMTLTGQVKVSDPDSAMFADRVVFDRTKNEATAEGAVRVSYLQQGSTSEPVHVLASRAVGHKATGITEFFAGNGADAKMWQGGSQVTAPILDFDRTKKTVYAHGGNGSQAVVHTVLVDNNPAKPGTKPQAPVRVLSRDMTYTDATREVVFHGPVQVNDQDGVMRSKETTVYLTAKDTPRPATHAPAEAADISLGGKVDHIIATGAVELEQPGRKATGERLVYTASDRLSVLTGSRAASPKMVDETNGSVTGAQLRFRSGDDSVEVVSGDGAEHVHTITKMKPKEPKDEQ